MGRRNRKRPIDAWVGLLCGEKPSPVRDQWPGQAQKEAKPAIASETVVEASTNQFS